MLWTSATNLPMGQRPFSNLLPVMQERAVFRQTLTPVATGAFNTLDVQLGVITATPNAFKGILATETCVLTPTADANDRLQWAYSGGCLTQGYVKN
ncbi:hypothetical protein ACU4GD_02620 [Cupriavidus basilensis]